MDVKSSQETFTVTEQVALQNNRRPFTMAADTADSPSVLEPALPVITRLCSAASALGALIFFATELRMRINEHVSGEEV